MIEAAGITTVGAAFVAGLVTSLHCVGMCGPLACAFVPAKASDAKIHAITSIYHLMRILSYTLIGAIAGAIGQGPLNYFHGNHLHYLPWVLVIFFVIVGLGLEQRMPKPAFISKAFFKLRLKTQKWPKSGSAAALGAATPFLPCGPLYLVFGVALTTGSPLKGAEFLFAFALGTLPLIYLAHSQYVRLQERVKPARMRLIQRLMALGAAFMIGARLMAIEPSDPEAIETEGGEAQPTVNCPACIGHDK